MVPFLEEFITAQFESHRSEHWMGMRRYNQHGRFLWTDNTDVRFTNWKSGYPRQIDWVREVYIIHNKNK